MLLCLKRNFSQTFKSSSCKKVFPKCAYHIDTICFNECFLFHVMIERRYFLYKFIFTQRFVETAMLLYSLKQVFWKKSAFYIYYLHNNITMLLTPRVHKQSSYFLNLLIALFTPSVCECTTFSLINEVFKTQNLKSSPQACFLLRVIEERCS